MAKNLIALIIFIEFSFIVLAFDHQLTWATESEKDWERTLVAAKQEGTVVLGVALGPEVTATLRRSFMEAYGIKLEYITGKGSLLRAKVLAEQKAGLYLVDLMIMGAVGHIQDLKPAGALDALKPQLTLPEVIDPNAWYAGSQLWADREGKYALLMTYSPSTDILVNTSLVRPDDFKSNSDLLDPKWRGKIVFQDPTRTGSGQKWFQMVSRALGYEFMEKFAKQEPLLLNDNRQMVEWVARGNYPLLVGADQATGAEFLHSGAPIKLVLPNDVLYAGSSGGTVSLLNRAPHPNATKVFLNWVLSREGSTIYSKAVVMQSARVDVSIDHLDPDVIRKPGVIYDNYETEDVLLARKKAVGEAKRIFFAKQ